MDCTRKAFYLPGETVPSLRDRLEEIAIRVRNVAATGLLALSGLFGWLGLGLLEPLLLTVYMCECLF